MTVGELRRLWIRSPADASSVWIAIARVQAARAAARCHLSADDAEEIESETTVLMCDPASTFRLARDESDLGGWLAATCRHLATDELRRQRRWHGTISGGVGPVARRRRRRESRAARLDALRPPATEGLTPEQSAALSLYLKGWTYAEIALGLSISAAAARDRVRRAWLHVERDRLQPASEAHRPLPPVGPGQLTARQRRIHALWNVDRCSYRDIARVERFSLNACKAAIHRIRLALGEAGSTAPPSPPSPP